MAQLNQLNGITSLTLGPMFCTSLVYGVTGTAGMSLFEMLATMVEASEDAFPIMIGKFLRGCCIENSDADDVKYPVEPFPHEDILVTATMMLVKFGGNTILNSLPTLPVIVDADEEGHDDSVTARADAIVANREAFDIALETSLCAHAKVRGLLITLALVAAGGGTKKYTTAKWEKLRSTFFAQSPPSELVSSGQYSTILKAASTLKVPQLHSFAHAIIAMVMDFPGFQPLRWLVPQLKFQGAVFLEFIATSVTRGGFIALKVVSRELPKVWAQIELAVAAMNDINTAPAQLRYQMVPVPRSLNRVNVSQLLQFCKCINPEGFEHYEPLKQLKIEGVIQMFVGRLLDWKRSTNFLQTNASSYSTQLQTLTEEGGRMVHAAPGAPVTSSYLMGIDQTMRATDPTNDQIRHNVYTTMNTFLARKDTEMGDFGGPANVTEKKILFAATHLQIFIDVKGRLTADLWAGNGFGMITNKLAI